MKKFYSLLRGLALVFLPCFLMASTVAEAQQTIEEIRKQQWQENQYAAFAEARRRIATAHEEGLGGLSFADLDALEMLPLEIKELTALEWLELSGTQVVESTAKCGATPNRTL